MPADELTGARPTIASFVTERPLATGRVTLSEDAAHHARVRRLDVGDPVSLRDGVGGVAVGSIGHLDRKVLIVDVGEVTHVPEPPPVHLLTPVGDRDRMLWVAEKAVELGITSWRPVRWRRSRSVSPRGEGAGFTEKVRARMVQALAQSEGAWLPSVRDAVDFADAVADLPVGERLLLDGGAPPLSRLDAGAGATDGIVLALGPEGGLEPDEVDACADAGFRPCALPGNVLRFETAAIVGVAFAHDRLTAARANGRG